MIERSLAILGLAIGVAALALQAGLTVPLRLSQGDTLPGALVFFFSFFTILTNLGLVLVYLSPMVDWQALRSFRSDAVRTMFAALIVLVMAVYAGVLAQSWQPEGLFRVADIGLHYITPVVFVAWWLSIRARAGLRYRASFGMLLFPVLYVVYALLRGGLTGAYPYPFINVQTLGWGQVAVNLLLLLAVLVALFCGAIFINNRLVIWRSRQSRSI